MATTIVSFRKFIKTEPWLFFFLLTAFAIALFFRTYAYPERIYFYADSTLFVQAAYYAADNFKLPQIGPFAQAPFFTGPWWLWVLELLFIFPLGLLTPWYFMTFASLLFIVLIYFVGKQVGGKWLGGLAVFFTAISTAQIDNSFMTWNAAFDPFAGLLGLLFLLKYLKEKKSRYLFFLGFCLSLAVTIHFQTALLLPIVLVALVTTRPRLKNLAALFLGVLLPVLPFLYFDFRFNWFETRRILDYLLIGQYRIYVPNRWLTYLRDFWPTTWAWIIGGQPWVGGSLIALASLVSLLKLRQYRKYWRYFAVATAFALSIAAFRYYRGERFFYYTNFAHAFVLLLTAWTVFEIYKFKKIFGLLLFFFIALFTILRSGENLKPRVITYREVKNLVSQIYENHPGETFAIYECPFVASMVSTAVSYLVYYDGRESENGVKIGVCNDHFELSWRELNDHEVDAEYTYKNKSVASVYADMTEWWVKNPPRSLY